MASEFSVTFFGTRGSIPVSGDAHAQFGGATSCLVLRVGSREFIFDAGSGLVEYSDQIMESYADDSGPMRTYLFLTHAHLDHLIGLPYFGPLYAADSHVHMWGPRTSRFESFGKAIENFIHPPFFPIPLWEMPADLEFSDLSQGDVVYFLNEYEEPVQLRPESPRSSERAPSEDAVELKIETMHGYNHPKSGVNHYRVSHDGRTFVYATDTEGYRGGDRRLAEFAEDADLLVHDAMYTEDEYKQMPAPTQGFGHSTVRGATDLAERAGVDRLCLFHHSPSSTDENLEEIEALGQSHFKDTRLAYDGLTLDV